MKRHLLTATLIVFITFTLANISYAQSMGQGMAMMGEMAGKMLLTKSAVDLRMDMRKLWEDNSQWQITRRSRGKGFNLFGLKSRPCPKVI